jgi:hypothetical protein
MSRRSGVATDRRVADRRRQMNRKAVEAARIEFNRARDNVEALATLRPATDFEEIQTRWAAFLSAADRMFNKLKEGSKASSQSKHWYGTKVHERRTDPILCYLQHARNADEHTLEFITRSQPGFIREVAPTPEEHEAFERNKGDRPAALTGLAVLEITEPHVRLIDVVDRGVRYSPPPGCFKPYNTGMIALSKLEPILIEAEVMVTRDERT